MPFRPEAAFGPSQGPWFFPPTQGPSSSVFQHHSGPPFPARVLCPPVHHLLYNCDLGPCRSGPRLRSGLRRARGFSLRLRDPVLPFSSTTQGRLFQPGSCAPPCTIYYITATWGLAVPARGCVRAFARPVVFPSDSGTQFFHFPATRHPWIQGRRFQPGSCGPRAPSII